MDPWAAPSGREWADLSGHEWAHAEWGNGPFFKCAPFTWSTIDNVQKVDKGTCGIILAANGGKHDLTYLFTIQFSQLKETFAKRGDNHVWSKPLVIQRPTTPLLP